MKLQSSKKKKQLIIICVIVALVLAAAIALTAGLLIKNYLGNMWNDNAVESIVINSLPKTEYFVGESIDLSGLRIQHVTNKVDDIRLIEYPNIDMSVTGYDLSKPGEQTLTVTYKGFTTTFKITVREYTASTATLVSIEVCDLLDTYTVEKWNTNGPNLYGAYLKLTYSDGTTKGSYEETPLLWDYVGPLSKVNGAGTTQIVVKYIEGGVEVSTTVTITITN